MKERELNSTLHSSSTEQKPTKNTKVGDAGLDWHRRAFERCKQQAKEEQRSLNEIVSERYGVSSSDNIHLFQSFPHLVNGQINVIDK